jgi:hypothetical protein
MLSPARERAGTAADAKNRTPDGLDGLPDAGNKDTPEKAGLILIDQAAAVSGAARWGPSHPEGGVPLVIDIRLAVRVYGPPPGTSKIAGTGVPAQRTTK